MQYSSELYAGLEAETGLSTGYRQCGGLIVARTEDRMVQLRRTAATAAAFDLDCEMLTAEQAQERWPVIAIDDLLGCHLAARRTGGPTRRTSPSRSPRVRAATASGSTSGCGSSASTRPRPHADGA